MKIDQKTLDESWGLFITYMPNNISNANRDKFIQVRDKLQKQIDERGYADTDDPELTEWWLKIDKGVKRMDLTEKLKEYKIVIDEHGKEFLGLASPKIKDLLEWIRENKHLVDMDALRSEVVTIHGEVIQSIKDMRKKLIAILGD